MTRQDLFLAAATAVLLLGLAGLALAGVYQYQEDRARFQDSHKEQRK